MGVCCDLVSKSNSELLIVDAIGTALFGNAIVKTGFPLSCYDGYLLWHGFETKFVFL